MLTVDPAEIADTGDRVLDVGCGEGRHAHAAALAGATVVALDLDRERLLAARGDGDESTGHPVFCRADALNLPVPDGSFDVVICSEVLEHIPDYQRAIAELERVLVPGGSLAVSVPRYGPERLCWALSDAYHDVEGGHVRVFTAAQLREAVEDHGLRFAGRDYAHALHSPYWWLKCLWWERDSQGNPPAPLAAYERFLEWAEFEAPHVGDRLEWALDRVLGKSLIMYFDKQ